MKAYSSATDLVYALEPFSEVYEEAKPLLDLHWQEIAKNKQLLKLEPDEDFYLSHNKSNEIYIVTARHGGHLVGYVVWFIHTHPHYKSILTARNDVHFLLPEYRTGLNGYFMLKNAISLLRTIGVKYCYLSEKIGHEHPALMKRLGFAPLDITYSKDLTQ